MSAARKREQRRRPSDSPGSPPTPTAPAPATPAGQPVNAATGSSSDPALIYDAARQGKKVRFLMLFSLACLAGSLWAGYGLLLTYGTEPGDGGVLAPLPVRLTWGGGVAALGLAFALGMWIYGRYAVREIRWVPGEPVVQLATYRFFGSRFETLEAADVMGADARRDRVRTSDPLGLTVGISVDAPWLAVRVRGRRWPLVLDLQGNIVNRERLSALLCPRR